MKRALLILALLPAVARAADRPLALGEVVRAALAANTEVLLARVAVTAAEGNALAAAEPFDSAVVTAAARSDQRAFAPLDTASERTRTWTYDLSVSKRFRAGFELGPTVNVTRAATSGVPPVGLPPGAALPDVGDASARLRLFVPLLRDRGFRLTGAAERAARGEHEATRIDARQAQAVAALAAAQAYWQYLGARRRVEVLVAAEGRSVLIANETATLVKAQERTQADLTQARGQASLQRAARLAGEQDAVVAWNNLAEVMGLTSADMAALPPAATDFPAAGAEPHGDPRWLAELDARRPDLAASARRVGTAEERRRAARTELGPRLDLEVTGGYAGRSLDRSFVAPVGDHVPGVDLVARLSLELPLVNAGPRGRVTQTAAAAEQLRIASADHERRARNGVAAALEAVRRSRLALQESEQAAAALTTTVDTEKRKFQLGSSTLFEVIFAQDSLTNALLARIEGQRRYAEALAELRYQTGTLLAAPPAEPDPQTITLNLTTMP